MTRSVFVGVLALSLGAGSSALAVPAGASPGETGSFPLTLEPAVGNVPIALLVDLGSGQTLYSHGASRRFIPASITKVMTAFVAFELISKGQLKPQQRFRMSETAFRDWGKVGSTMFLTAGQETTVDELLLGIMNVSANDGCVVLAEGAAGSVANWVALMNAKAREIGMKDSHFGTPNGWMDGGNTYVSADDLVRLTDAMLTRHPTLYRRYVGHPVMRLNGITQRNHDPMLGIVPGADGIKTGFTNQAGYGFVGSAERNGRRLVLVIGGAARPADRAKAARGLMEWGFQSWNSRALFPAGAVVGEARVQGGTARQIRLVTPRATFTVAPLGQTPGAVSARIVYAGPLIAPIAKGETVAELEVRTAGNRAPARLPLLAAESVERAGPIDRLLNGLAKLFS